MVTINGIPLGNECFPNNERILKEIPSLSNDSNMCVEIEFKYETDIDISILIMCKKYIDDKFNHLKTKLIMKYVPYSRMDRSIEGYVFTLKYFCQMINDLKFDSVYILDPHSNVSKSLLNRCVEISIQENINKIFNKHLIDYVFYPDAGAMKRYSEILKFPDNVQYFYGDKKRNLQTGEIISYELINSPELIGRNVLIIDDLCSFGTTFLKCGEKLKNNAVANIFLYVSHCEDSIFKGNLLKSDVIKTVYTTDSLLSDTSHKKIIKL